MKRLRGLKALVHDVVDKGSQAVERVQLDTAKLPFDIVERMPGLKVPASGVRRIYNAGVSNVHGMIRLVNDVTSESLDVLLDVVAKNAPPAAAPEAEPAAAPEPAAVPPPERPARARSSSKKEAR
ncbi:MAG: hypothetical protein R3B70_08290 [Polyangiaceae bacterium]